MEEERKEEKEEQRLPSYLQLLITFLEYKCITNCYAPVVISFLLLDYLCSLILFFRTGTSF